ANCDSYSRGNSDRYAYASRDTNRHTNFNAAIDSDAENQSTSAPPPNPPCTANSVRRWQGPFGCERSAGANTFHVFASFLWSCENFRPRHGPYPAQVDSCLGLCTDCVVARRITDFSKRGYPGVGRGCGVGRGLGFALCVAVGDGVATGVGVAVGIG